MPAPTLTVFVLSSLPGLAGHLDDSRAAERAGDHRAEHAACAALLVSSSNGPGSDACRRRTAWLDARRDSDGSFDSLETLQQIRRNHLEMEPSVAWARVETVARNPGAASRVRDEAAVWLARGALERQEDPTRALEWTAPLWARLSPIAGSPGDLRAQVADLHARALLATGDEPGARAVEAAAGAPRSAVPREGLPLAIRNRNRERARLAAWAGLGLFGLAATPASLRTWTRDARPRPRGLAALLVVGIGATALGAAWDWSLAPGLLCVVGALGGVHLVAAGALAGTPAGPMRLAQRGLAVLGTLATAWLVSDAFGLAAQVGL